MVRWESAQSGGNRLPRVQIDATWQDTCGRIPGVDIIPVLSPGVGPWYRRTGLAAAPQTIALWLFDESRGLYPSSVLDSSSENDYPLVLGQGGRIVEGRFGNALTPVDRPPIEYPAGEAQFGLQTAPARKGRTVEPMTWANAQFCGLMTRGERHLLQEVGFTNPTAVRLNLGDFDWTVEFWFQPTAATEEPGVIFEIGAGPRGENDRVTRLLLNAGSTSFTLTNQPSGTELVIPSDATALDPNESAWHHLAFVYASGEQQLRHFVDGRPQPLPPAGRFAALRRGTEAYLSIGRDGRWGRPLGGRIDELRFSTGQVYAGAFDPPASFAPPSPDVSLKRGPPLLLADPPAGDAPIQLGSRKHLFVDDAIVATIENGRFVVNPPRKAERVIDRLDRAFRKHLTVVEDEENVIRIYYASRNDQVPLRGTRRLPISAETRRFRFDRQPLQRLLPDGDEALCL